VRPCCCHHRAGAGPRGAGAAGHAVNRWSAADLAAAWAAGELQEVMRAASWCSLVSHGPQAASILTCGVFVALSRPPARSTSVGAHTQQPALTDATASTSHNPDMACRRLFHWWSSLLALPAAKPPSCQLGWRALQLAPVAAAAARLWRAMQTAACAATMWAPAA
jgi:hypothetical protein